MSNCVDVDLYYYNVYCDDYSDPCKIVKKNKLKRVTKR